MVRTQRLFMVVLLALLAAVFMLKPVLAMDLQQAREQHLVAERLDGYVAAVKPSSDVDAMVKEVNERRREEYSKISASNGQSTAVVGKVAAEKIIQGLKPGTLYQGTDGSWKKR